MKMINNLNEIPGMVEPVEQQMLTELAQNIKFEDNDQIIEFGSFFGKSTYSLASGLKKNKSKLSSNKIIAYDSFMCRKDGSFYPHVLQFAKLGKVDNLIKFNKNDIIFEDIFKYFLNDEINNKLVKIQKAELEDSYPIENANIALLHVDSPKFYNELKPILFRFFPKLKNNSIIIFQDYFFHWSATLIAAIQLLKKLNIILFEYSKASSLCTKVIKIPTSDDLLFIDDEMKNDKNILNLLDESINCINDYPIDRPNLFVHRLYLAKIQFLWENGDFERSTHILSSIFKNNKTLSQNFIDDYFKLMEKGFSLRSLYIKDH
jgi:hypothetical protein